MDSNERRILEEDENGEEHMGLEQKACQTDYSSVSSSTWGLINAGATAKVQLGATASKPLSSQVMEYYQKYSQNSNLNQYFSLSSTSYPVDCPKYYYSIYELKPGEQSSNSQDYDLKSYFPRERRRWARPPLIGQSSSTNGSSSYIKSMTELQSPRSDDQEQRVDDCKESENQNSVEIVELASEETSSPPATIERKTTISPTSSVASHKPLEWDSGADVGYQYASGLNGTNQRLSAGGNNKKLSTIERMALAHRLDPEGTNDTPCSIRTTALAAAVLSLTSAGTSKLKPNANSTPLVGNISGSESEIEITPIVKSHAPGIITSDELKSEESKKQRSCRIELLKEIKDVTETPKSANIFKLPHALKYPTEDSKPKLRSPAPLPSTAPSTPKEKTDDENQNEEDTASPLKKSSSMNLLAAPPKSRLTLKRSQSDLNLCGNEKNVPKLIFNSTSSIATVVNSRPTTCNKLIQTSMRVCTQESIGIQVSVLKDEEKPPLPKRATSLAPRSVNSILKNPKSTYKIHNPKASSTREKSISKEEEHNEKRLESSSDTSRNASLTPQPDDTENNVTGRANSFEYFPGSSGHIYENVPNGSSSQVSSVDTGRSNSTMPNTSSSVDEKLWGESDNMVRDLERSVNILKSLVDANKLDKQVKRRLIHHVVKRLVNAKYTDEKIERNLEENVPWNPADARNKVYRQEIIQALAKNTTDSSDDWKPTQKKKSPKKSSTSKDARAMKEIISIPAEIESINSDKFDKNTDRTVMDGRKARMGVRADDCDRHSSTNTPTNKSESSECFLPQCSFNKNEKIKDMFITSTSNSSAQDQNRALLDAVVNSRRTPIDSSNEAGNSADWRMPTTMSERRFEMRRCSNSDSGDTKLVSYAEMEKRNQLIWITNEISHLSNLKKLLEQPKTKSERSTKASPRKNKQSSSKQHKTPSYRLQNGELDDVSQLNKQWSSHNNLANCTSPNSNSVTRFKKRNSCTQTATESTAAYSRTGSEIVSARYLSPNKKMISVCVQTSKTTTPPVSPSSQAYSSCPIHQPALPQTCECVDRGCQCCKSKNLSQQRHLFSDEDKDDDESEAKFVCNDSEDAKATKNHVNANKLKCTCGPYDKMNSKLKLERPKKSTAACQTYEQCHCGDSSCSCSRHKQTESSCQCSRDCNCENKLISRFEKLRVDQNLHQRKTSFEKESSTSCGCGCRKLEEVESARTEYSYHSNKKPQPYFLTNSNKQQNSRDCRCGKKSESPEKIHHESKQMNRATNTNCCKLCGTTYKTDRKCPCVFNNYPKPVAYELSFVNDNKHSHENESRYYSRVELEIKSLDKKSSPSSSAGSQGKPKRTCACGQEQRTIKRCDSDCREQQKQRKFRNEKSTLQDYLVTNNPRFADHAEIRRRYVSEIHQLRQLRKDRRVQLLAMATTSNIFSQPTATKVTKCVQKRISDQEMRSIIKKRYQQLSEVQAKRKQQRFQEQGRNNRLMAKIYCKKLQQKVLKGQVDLSQSVSVISNL